jgi:GNAT superfamily N-acetyltransferase
MRAARFERDGTLSHVAARDVSVHDAPLTKLELQDAALVSAHAFHTDPFFEFLSPRAIPRARGLVLWSHSICAHLGPTGSLLTARRDGRIVGVGAWVPPGGYPYPASTQLAQTLGALHALYRIPSAMVKGLRYLTAIEKAHPKEDLWYLQLLACAPEHQRTGVGAALLHGTLARADDEGVPAYLETQNEDNLAYYARFGFEVATTLSPVRGGPPLWALRREPRGAEAR